MKIKKVVLAGMILVIFCVAVLFIYPKSGTNTIDPTNQNNSMPVLNIPAETDIYSPNEVIPDETLEDMTKYENNARYADGELYTAVGLSGENTKIVLSSMAIQNVGMVPAWTVLLHSNSVFDGTTLPKYVDSRAMDPQLYNIIYVYLSKVTITADGKEQEAILPANKFFIEGDFVKIFPDETTYLQLTFINDNTTLRKTVDGQYVYAPKINVVAYKNATTVLNSDNVNVTVGQLWTNITVGMNLKGSLMSGYGLVQDKQIKFENNTLSYV
jgi:hypothetical protein